MRQFVAETEPDKNGCLYIEGKKARYLSAVLRCVPGDMLYVRLPGGGLQQMTVASVDSAKKRLVLQLAGASIASSSKESAAKALPVAQKSGAELWLFQFAAKPAKMELIVRQAVECGVSRIIPVEGEFCQRGSLESVQKKTSGSDGRWERIVTEAREQSGSPVETQISPSLSVEKSLDLWHNHLKEISAQQNNLSFVLYERTENTMPLHRALASVEDVKAVALFVGAEGGISPAEYSYLTQNGVQGIHFATNILRCETAALYGIAAVQSALVEKELWQFKE